MPRDVIVSGPVFDGRAEVTLREGVKDVRHRLARDGERLARAAFAAQIREDTGRFLGSITSTDHSTAYSTHSGHKTYTLPVVVSDIDMTVVTTETASYGPWLEGVGSRNDTTRFRGYHGFRKAAGELNAQAEPKADEYLRPYVERCN